LLRGSSSVSLPGGHAPYGLLRPTARPGKPGSQKAGRQPRRKRSSTSEARGTRGRFSKLLAGARAGEEIVITKGREPQARLLPPAVVEKRETAPLRHLGLPDDLFDREDAEQAAPHERRDLLSNDPTIGYTP